jgi:hypothetical protein
MSVLFNALETTQQILKKKYNSASKSGQEWLLPLMKRRGQIAERLANNFWNLTASEAERLIFEKLDVCSLPNAVVEFQTDFYIESSVMEVVCQLIQFSSFRLNSNFCDTACLTESRRWFVYNSKKSALPPNETPVIIMCQDVLIFRGNLFDYSIMCTAILACNFFLRNENGIVRALFSNVRINHFCAQGCDAQWKFECDDMAKICDIRSRSDKVMIFENTFKVDENSLVFKGYSVPLVVFKNFDFLACLEFRDWTSWFGEMMATFSSLFFGVTKIIFFEKCHAIPDFFFTQESPKNARTQVIYVQESTLAVSRNRQDVEIVPFRPPPSPFNSLSTVKKIIIFDARGIIKKVVD